MIRKIAPILGITMIDIFGFSILIPLLPYFVEHFGASDFTVGAVLATFALCQLVSAPVWGTVSDRIGRKRVLAISQAGAAVGWIVLAFANTIGVVFLARVIEGVSGGNISVTQAYVSDLVPEKDRAKAFGYVGAAFGLGFVAGPALGGILFAHYGYTATFLVAAALQLLTLLLTIVYLPESREAGPTSEVAAASDIVRSLREPSVAPILFQRLASSLALYGFFATIALMLANELGFNPTQTSFTFSFFGVLNVLMQVVVVERISERFGDRRAANIGFTGLVIGFTLLATLKGIVLFGLAMIVIAFGMSVVNATVSALLSSHAPENQRGSLLGVGSSMDSIAGIVMPPIATGVLGAAGVSWTAAIFVGFALLALGIGLRMRAPAMQRAA